MTNLTANGKDNANMGLFLFLLLISYERENVFGFFSVWVKFRLLCIFTLRKIAGFFIVRIKVCTWHKNRVFYLTFALASLAASASAAMALWS